MPDTGNLANYLVANEVVDIGGESITTNFLNQHNL